MVLKRGKTWYVRLNVVGAAGKRIQKWISCPTIRSRAEAKREETRLRALYRSDERINSKSVTLGEYLNQWLAGTRHAIETSTYETNERWIANHLIPHLGAAPLSEIDPGQLRLLYSQLKTSGRKCGVGGLSARTIGHLHRLLYQAMQQAVQDGLVSSNPLALVKPPKVDPTETVVLDEFKALQLLEKAEGTSLHIPILLGVCAGMRRGEILALRWEDVDFERGTISVNWSLARVNAGIEIKRPKSASSRRLIAIPKFANLALQREFQLRNNINKACLVVHQLDKKPIAPDAFSHAFATFLQKNGLPHMRFHDLRHTHVSLLIKYGVEMKAISSRVGHSSIGITMDLYGHLLDGVDREAASRLEQGFLSAASEEGTARLG